MAQGLEPFYAESDLAVVSGMQPGSPARSDGSGFDAIPAALARCDGYINALPIAIAA
jgi:hypothetical protein